MKASELIKHLERAIEQHGDLPVAAYGYSYESDVEAVTEVDVRYTKEPGYLFIETEFSVPIK